jgi:hypothetical protein
MGAFWVVALVSTERPMTISIGSDRNVDGSQTALDRRAFPGGAGGLLAVVLAGCQPGLVGDGGFPEGAQSE